MPRPPAREGIRVFQPAPTNTSGCLALLGFFLNSQRHQWLPPPSCLSLYVCVCVL